MVSDTPTAADLLAFDGRDPPGAEHLRLRQVIPVAPVDPDDLVALVRRIDWSGCPALARILGSGESSVPTPPLAEEKRPKAANGWHPIPRQGIDGQVDGFDVLVGTADFVEDAGISVSEDAHRKLADHRARGWASILVGACHSEARPAHRSLLGIIAIGPDAPAQAPAATPDSGSPPPPPADEATWPADLQRLTEEPLVAACEGSSGRRKDRSVLLGRLAIVALLVAASAVGGLLFSITIVEPDEVLIVQRFGRIAVCEGGLHLLPFWPIETRTTVRPGAVRCVDVFSAAPSAAGASNTRPSSRQLLLTGDVPAPQETPSDRTMAAGSRPAGSADRPATVPAAFKPIPTLDVEDLDAEEPTPDEIGTFAGLLVEVAAHVEYTVSDPEVYVLSEAEPGPMIAAAARSALVELIASRPLLEIIGPQRAVLAERARLDTQKLVDDLRLGIRIQAVTFDHLAPPRATGELDMGAAFEEISVARLEAGEAAHRSRIEAYRILADARTRAVRILADAIAERARLLQSATGMGLPAPTTVPAGTSRPAEGVMP